MMNSVTMRRMDKAVIGSIAAAVGILNYIPYIWSILKGKMRPHAFSWLVWGVLTGIAFAAQVTGNGGAGAWVTGTTAIGCFVIFLLALFKGQRAFPLFDWLSLAGAFLAMAVWWLTKNPLGAVLLVSLVDFLGFLPTFRKGWEKPFEDSTLLFGVGALKFVIGIFALDTFDLITGFYPLLLIVLNGGFVLILMFRRMQLK